MAAKTHHAAQASEMRFMLTSLSINTPSATGATPLASTITDWTKALMAPRCRVP